MLLRKNDSGRSIVEMLGVLAIMGVITVMGISGYSQAIGKINRNQVVEDVVRIAQETRGLYAAQGDYIVNRSVDAEGNVAESSTQNDIGEILNKMKVKLANPYGKNYEVTSNGKPAGKNPGFTISVSGVPQVDCVYFTNMAWTDAVLSGTTDGSFSTVTNQAEAGEDDCKKSADNTFTVSYK